MDKELLYCLLLRENFGEFVKFCFKNIHQKSLELNWHHKMIISELENCRLGFSKRLVVNIPPRQLKSEICSVYYSVYLLGNATHTTDIMILTRNKKLGILWLEMIKKLITTNSIQNIFPNLQIILHKNDKLSTSKGSISIHSPNSPIIGAGADIFIIDDPISVKDARDITKVRNLNKWFKEELITRMNDKQDGLIILAMQRIHLLDLSAFMLKNQENTKHINIPALNKTIEKYEWLEWHLLQRKFVTKSYTRTKNEPINPSRESLTNLNALKEEMGESFETQYNQNPVVDLEQEFLGKIKDLKTIPSVKKARLVVNCIVNKEKLLILVSLTSRNKPKEIFLINYIEQKLPENLEEFLIKTLDACLNSLNSAYTSYKYQAKLQLLLICHTFKDTKKLEENLAKLRINDINLTTHIINKVLIPITTYQKVIKHMFTYEVFDDTTIYVSGKLQDQLKDNLQSLTPTPLIKLFIENVAVQGK